MDAELKEFEIHGGEVDGAMKLNPKFGRGGGEGEGVEGDDYNSDDDSFTGSAPEDADEDAFNGGAVGDDDGADDDEDDDEEDVMEDDNKGDKEDEEANSNLDDDPSDDSGDEGENEDENGDEDDIEDTNKFKKFNAALRSNYITEMHPESASHNDDEIHSLAHVVRDQTGAIIDPLHRTIPILTKYEKTRILGVRTKQINEGAPPYVSVKSSIIDGYIIAMRELEEKKIPFIVRRPLPNGGSEYWYLQDLEII